MTIPGKSSAVNIFDLAEEICAKLGIEYPSNISTDDRIHRISTTDRRGRNKNGAIKLFSDGRGGIAWNWVTGESETFFLGGSLKQLTEAERQEIARRRKEAAEALERQYAEAAAKARRIWNSAALALPSHPYLERKGVEPYGVRERWGKLIIPVYGEDKTIISIQMIAGDGQKRFLKDARNSGIFVINAGRKSGPVLIAEGFATAATLAAATFCTVVCAFNASALGGAAKRIMAQTDRPVIICGDNDHTAGKSEGQATETGAQFIIPDFEGFERGDNDTDFNDLANIAGLSEVAKQVRYAMKNGVQAGGQPEPRREKTPNEGRGENSSDERGGARDAFVPPDIIDSDDFRGSAPHPRLWCVEGMVLGDNVTLFSGDGGQGKTTVAMQLALAMQCESFWLDRKVSGGSVLYVSAEESRNDLHELYANVSAPVAIPPIHPFKMISLADRIDPALVTRVEGKPQATEMLNFIESTIESLSAKLLILDASADFCDINEIDRIQVRGTIAILRKIALTHKCGVMLLSHPSVDGMKTKRGYSGSTHWNNSVRSRLYMSTPDDAGEDDQNSGNYRIIEVPKRNKSAPIPPINLIYRGGRFVTRRDSDVLQTDRIARARTVFMDLLAEHVRINYPVSHLPKAQNYAPRAFQQHPKNPGITDKEFKYAMMELLMDHPSPAKIRIAPYGPPSKRRERIEAV